MEFNVKEAKRNEKKFRKENKVHEYLRNITKGVSNLNLNKLLLESKKDLNEKMVDKDFLVSKLTNLNKMKESELKSYIAQLKLNKRQCDEGRLINLKEIEEGLYGHQREVLKINMIQSLVAW